MIGRKLAHYEVRSLLGRGGMGEVYRAHDAKLGRDVALKVLPREMSGDPERLARFSREARTLAALQHPNVASIYGFEEADGVRFLVMELVEGEDLAERLRRGPVALATALEYAHQIAEGLEAAHEKGIVHRDLKPANVKLTPEGTVKVLDFGLARAIQGESASEGDPANSPTITAAMTQQGMILGTAAYMSPEQARGGVADARADIWAFGVLVWEMLTGRRLFEGETVSDTLASVLKLPPDWSQLPEETPPRVRDLLERCLAKKRRDRLGSIADARLEIEWVMAGRGDVSSAATAVTAPARRWPWLVAGVALVALAFFAGRSLVKAPEAANTPTYVLSIPIPEHLAHLGDLIAPDGSCIAVRARLRDPATPAEAAQALYLRRLDGDEFRRVEGSLGLTAYSFSHDSKWLGLVAPASPGSSQMRFWRMAVDGSAPPTALFNWAEEWSRTFLWLPDGDLLVDLHNTRILRVPTDGRSPGTPVDLVLPTGFTGFSAYPRHNSILPGGRRVVSWSHSYATGRYDQTGVVIDLDTGEMKPLLNDSGALTYWPTGHLLFGRSATMLAVEFDLDRLETRGPTFAVASGLRQFNPWDHPNFEISNNGVMTYYPGQIGGDARQLVWLDPEFEVIAPWSDDRRTFTNAIMASTSGDRLVVTITGNDGLFSIWSSELSVPRLQPWIERAGSDCAPSCLSADGEVLIWGWTDGASAIAYRRDKDGIDTPLLTAGTNDPPAPACLADDNRTLLFTRWPGGPAIHSLSLPPAADPDAVPTRIDDVPVLIANASWPVISPDGRWLAYASTVSGRNEVYVRAWLGAGKMGAPLRVSREGADAPQWFVTPQGALQIRFLQNRAVHAADFDPSTGRASPPVLITEEIESLAELLHLDDGRILGLLRDDDEKPVDHIGVRIGFADEMKRRTGAAGR